MYFKRFNNIEVNTSSLIREIINRLYSTRIFIEFDIIIVFNKIRIKVKKEEKIAFLIYYKIFKYTVILLELYNALSTY